MSISTGSAPLYESDDVFSVSRLIIPEMCVLSGGMHTYRKTYDSESMLCSKKKKIKKIQKSSSDRS